jgi:hypothetical protein
VRLTNEYSRVGSDVALVYLFSTCVETWKQSRWRLTPKKGGRCPLESGRVTSWSRWPGFIWRLCVIHKPSSSPGNFIDPYIISLLLPKPPLNLLRKVIKEMVSICWLRSLVAVEYKSDKARDLTCTVKEAYGPISGTIIIWAVVVDARSLCAAFWLSSISPIQWRRWIKALVRLILINLSNTTVPKPFKKVRHHVSRLVNYSNTISTFGQAKVVQVAIILTKFVVSFYSIKPGSTRGQGFRSAFFKGLSLA